MLLLYRPSKLFERTEAEMTDQKLSWARPDEAFFAAGACHILAFEFVRLSQNPNYKIIFIKPKPEFGPVGTHVYVRNGDQAFDFNGWTDQVTLLTAHKRACQEDNSNWDYDLIEITSDLETFSKENNHLLPTEFAHDPIPRAQRYIGLFKR